MSNLAAILAEESDRRIRDHRQDFKQRVREIVLDITRDKDQADRVWSEMAAMEQREKMDHAKYHG